MRVKVKSIKRICIVLGIISLFLCIFVFIRNAIAKSKAIDYINNTVYYNVIAVGGATQEQKDSIKSKLDKMGTIDKYEAADDGMTYIVHIKINNSADIDEMHFATIENSLKKIEYVEKVETNCDEILKYYGIYGYKKFIQELNNK